MSGMPFQMPEGIPPEMFEGDVEFPAPEAAPEPEQVEDTGFDPRVHNDVMGMIFLGALTAEFDVFGHRVVLSTLTAGEELEVALVSKPYVDSRAEGHAMAIATVAAAIETVDGKEPWPKPLGPATGSALREKFEWLKENWHWATIDAVFNHYAELLLRQVDAFEELQGKSTASRPTH